jgi:hypothetical protein
MFLALRFSHLDALGCLYVSFHNIGLVVLIVSGLNTIIYNFSSRYTLRIRWDP